MSSQPRKATAFLSNHGLMANDSVVAITTAGALPADVNNALVTVGDLLANSNAPHVSRGNLAMSTANLVVRGSVTPANGTVDGVPGQLFFDDTYGYRVCANGEIKRWTLSSF